MVKGISLTHIFIDCKEPLILQEFYHRLTGLEKRSMYNSPGLVISKLQNKQFSSVGNEQDSTAVMALSFVHFQEIQLASI